MLLEVNGLTKSFGGRTVLDGACFTVDHRQVLGIMGPSGQGKSTVARILCGTLFPDGGSVSFQGETLTAAGKPYNEAFRRDIQLIPQQPFSSLDPRQRVGDAICEPLLFHKIVRTKSQAAEKARELLEKVLLDPELFYRRPGELSGGQAQRVLIARSLTVSPKLLIADEATSMLDISSQAQIVQIFRDLVESEGLALICISHDRPLVESICGSIYNLSEGKMKKIK